MKWVRFEDQGTPRFGVLNQDTITATALTWTEILAGRTPDAGSKIKLDQVRLLAPVERPA
jgi:hypothetical protein